MRFGKLKVLRTSMKSLAIQVNGADSGLRMKLGKGGEGYFEYEATGSAEDEAECERRFH